MHEAVVISHKDKHHHNKHNSNDLSSLGVNMDKTSKVSKGNTFTIETIFNENGDSLDISLQKTVTHLIKNKDALNMLLEAKKAKKTGV